MFKSNIEYQECYCMPAHLYSRFLEFLDEETQTELKTLNKRINPNLDFFTKTLKDIEPYSKNTKKNKKKNNDKSKESTETINNESNDSDTDENDDDKTSKNMTSDLTSNSIFGTPRAASTPGSNAKNNTTDNNNNTAISTKKSKIVF